MKKTERLDDNETLLLKERYARRKTRSLEIIYDPLSPAFFMGQQEKQRALVRLIKQERLYPVSDKKVLEIGCGSGGNLLDLLRLGFLPENLVGNELLEERSEMARHLLPTATKILCGDASKLTLPHESFDVVFQSTVFTSILDDDFQKKLADVMWSLVKPGGGVIWYDFTFNNPANPDVKGIPVKKIRRLFPQGRIKTWRLTLAPPISRRVTRIHPNLYTVFNSLIFLRTHVLCWISKSVNV